MLELLSNPSVKRAVVGGITAALIALNKKLGLQMDLGDIGALVTLAIAFIGQSAMKEVAAAKVEAAATIKTPSDAAKVLGQ